MRKAILRSAVAFCLIGGLSTSLSAQQPKATVPSESAQKLAVARMHHRIDPDLEVESPEEQVTLAKRLIKIGLATDDQDYKYILLQESLRLATQALDAEVADKIVREIVKAFDVDGKKLWESSALRLQKSPNLATILMKRAKESLLRGDFDQALVYSMNAEVAARNYADPDQIKLVSDQRTDLISKIAAAAKPIPNDRIISGRVGEAKKKLLKKHGATKESQRAVADGLRWLKRNQKKDGGWSMDGPFSDGATRDNRCAATAMAMLAFLGDGHTHLHGNYQSEVLLAKNFLVKMQTKDGFFKERVVAHERMYSQAMATIAICELFSMTGDPKLREPAKRSIQFAEFAQSKLGGWRYEPQRDADTSVTSWFLQALIAGRDAGIEIDQKKFDAVSMYLDSASHYEGAAFGYQPKSRPSPSMTAAGLFCRQQLGQKRDDPAVLAGAQALLQDAPFNDTGVDTYYWYHTTRLLRHVGGVSWEKWSRAMTQRLPTLQEQNGNEKGSWPPKKDVWQRGRLYTTCFSIWCLEAYYRHLSPGERP